MVATDENTRQFILQEYEKAIENRGGKAEKNKEKILEKIYSLLHSEDATWDDVYNLADKHNSEWGLGLSDVMVLADSIEDTDLVQTNEDEEITQDLSNGKKQALKMQIKAQPGKENIVRTEERISNNDRRGLTEEVWNEERKAAFIISKQHSYKGRIALKLSRTKERFNLSTIFADKEGNGVKINHFSEPMSKTKGLVQILKHTESFYQYKFVSDDDEEFIVLSDKDIDPQRCTIHGTRISLGDFKTLGENRKLPVDQELIFMHSMEPAIQPMTDQELNAYKQEHSIDHDFLARKVFGDFTHPEWYEKMILSVLFVKNDNGYPSHLMQKAAPGTAKSTVLESITCAVGESSKPFSGTSSTIKGLVPSFSESPPDEGYLMRANRVAAVDEKFNLLSNTVQSGNSRMKDAFRPMLDLLEHSSREFSSGNGSISGKTEATMIAMGNPSYGISSILDAIESDKIDEAYLSRFLLYEMLDSHIDYINEHKSEFSAGSDEQYMPEQDDSFVSLLDTMRMRHVTGIDYERVSEIHNELLEIVPSVFIDTYKARYEHHLLNLVAGMAKIRFLTGDADELVAEEEDYRWAREIMETLIGSWGEVQLAELSHRSRINSLRHDERLVWQEITDNPGVRDKDLFNRVSVDKLARVLTTLTRAELVVSEELSDGRKVFHPYWTDEFEEIMDDTGDE